MPVECETDSGWLNPNSSNSTINLNQGNELNQVSVAFSGNSKSVRDSYMILDYGGGDTYGYPTPWELQRIHGGTGDGSQMNIASYNKTSNFYSYFIDFSFELNNSADIVLQNGDSHDYTRYECVALYHS